MLVHMQIYISKQFDGKTRWRTRLQGLSSILKRSLGNGDDLRLYNWTSVRTLHHREKGLESTMPILGCLNCMLRMSLSWSTECCNSNSTHIDNNRGYGPKAVTVGKRQLEYIAEPTLGPDVVWFRTRTYLVLLDCRQFSSVLLCYRRIAPSRSNCVKNHLFQNYLSKYNICNTIIRSILFRSITDTNSPCSICRQCD